MSSIIFFFTTGYLSRVFSEYLSNEKIMKKIDLIIILIMSFLVLGIVYKAVTN
jgi:arginine exporter protein ArgO